jgi:hypothetical protein
MHDPVRPAFPATSRSSELAAALLDVVNEPELDDFVSSLVGEAARSAGRPIPAHVGRTLVASLTQTAERTLPALSVALAEEHRPPAPVATQVAARLFGVETEGMSAEDRDFEIARQFVRYAQAEARRAAGAS